MRLTKMAAASGEEDPPHGKNEPTADRWIDQRSGQRSQLGDSPGGQRRGDGRFDDADAGRREADRGRADPGGVDREHEPPRHRLAERGHGRAQACSIDKPVAQGEDQHEGRIESAEMIRTETVDQLR